MKYINSKRDIRRINIINALNNKYKNKEITILELDNIVKKVDQKIDIRNLTWRELYNILDAGFMKIYIEIWNLDFYLEFKCDLKDINIRNSFDDLLNKTINIIEVY